MLGLGWFCTGGIEGTEIKMEIEKARVRETEKGMQNEKVGRRNTDSIKVSSCYVSKPWFVTAGHRERAVLLIKLCISLSSRLGHLMR